MQNLRAKVILSLIFALVVILALAFYADLPQLLDAIGKFHWQFLPLALGVTLVNYLLRFVRWHYYLSVIDLRTLPRRDSFLIFFSGLSLTMTPGKVGELMKAFLLKERAGASVSATAPIIAAERLTDLLGVFFLAAIGLAFFPVGLTALALFLIAVVAFIIVVQQRTLAERVLQLAARLPLLGRFVPIARQLYASTYLLLRLRPLLIALALAIVAWFAECVAFFFVLIGLGQAPSVLLLFHATFIYAAASLLGAISMLPGGLGATEGGMALLLQQIVSLPRDQAVAATLSVRLCTLWFAVLLGLIALLFLGLPKLKLDPRKSPSI